MSAPTNKDGFLEVFKQGLQDARKQRKTDEILEFIRKNWRLFCSSKAEMDNLFEEMEQQRTTGVDAIASMLGLPDEVFFKKTKMADNAELFLHTKSSALYKLFLKKRDLAGRCICIFMVAGDHTVVMTDMCTSSQPGLVHLSVTPEDPRDNRLEIFTVADAQLRLPELFNHKELE